MRTSVRWMLPAAGTVAVAIAMAPHAAAAGFFAAEPTSPTVVDTPLTWTFTANGGEQCDLTSDVGVSDSQPCGSGQYAYTPTTPGTYTLTVSDPSTSPATTLATSSPVAVAPAAPQPVRAGGSDTAPTWSFTLPAGASATCTVTHAGTTFTTIDPCPDPFTTDLSAGPYGTYTVDVVVHENQLDSAPGVASYDVVPPAPTVVRATPATQRSNDTSPTFTITDNAAGSGHTFACTVTGPGGYDNPVAACAGTTTVDLSAAPSDGLYTLQVLETADGVQTQPATATYYLDRSITPVQVVLTPDGGGRSITGSITEPDTDGITYTCSVLELPALAPSRCGASIVIDLPATAAEGPYTVQVTAKDGAGNATSDTAHYTLDVTGPTVAPSATSTPASPGTSSSVTWTLAPTEAGETFTCGSVTPGASAVCSGTTVAMSITGNDGSYSVTVTTADSFGNTGTSFTLTYVRDTTPPAVPTVAAGSASSTGSGRAASWTVADADRGGDLDHYRCAVTVPTSGSATATCDAATGQVTLTIGAGSPDGTYRVAVYAVDALGNESATALILTYVLDTHPPAAPTVTPAAGTGTTGYSPTPSWSVSGVEPGAGISCTVSGPGGAVPAGLVTCGATVSVDLSGLADGSYSVVVTVTDAAGNSTSAPAVTYRLDRVPPPAPTTASATTATGHLLSSTWTVSDTDPAFGHYLCSVSGPQGATASATCSPTGDVTLSIAAGSPDGTYVVDVFAVDAAGNVSQTLLELDYVLDTAAPAPATVTPVVKAGSTGTTGNSRSPSWTVTNVEPGALITCAVTGPGGVVAAGAVTCGPTVTVDLTGLPDGSYSLTVTLTDAAGNSASAAAVSYVLDTVPPVAPTVTPVTGPGSFGTTGSSAAPSWTVTGVEPGATVTCAVVGPNGALASARVSCGSTVTLNLNGLPDGTYTLTVTVTDAVGNARDAVPASYVFDTVAPPTPSIVGGTGSPANTRTPTWSLSDADPTVSYACQVSGPAGFTASVSCSSGTSVALTIAAGSPDGTYVVTIDAVDPAGNVSRASLVISYLLDTTGPARPTASSVPSPSNVRQVTWSLTPTETGETYTCVVDGGAAVTCSGSSVALSLSGSPDGTYTVIVTPHDHLGNAGVPLTLTYSLDTTGPVAPASTVVASPGVSRSVSWTLSGTESVETYTCALTVGTGVTVSCAGTSIGLSLAGAADGTYAVTVTPYDYLGNAGTPVTLTYVLDTTGPAAPTASAVTSPDNRRSVTWVLTATEAGERYACTVAGRGASVSCDATGVTLSLAGAADGVYVVTVVPIDALGNHGIPLVLGYTLDTTGPAQPRMVTTPASPAVNRSVGWTINDAESPVSYRCQQGGPVTFAVTCGTTVTMSLPASAPDGVYTITVTPYDDLGNPGVPLTLTYVLDTTPPVAPVASIVSPGNDVTPTPVLVVEPGTSLTCAIERYFLPVATVACGSDGTVDLSGFGDGEYEISITATDAAGNVSAASAPYVYVLDTLAPITPVLTPPASPSPIEDPVWRWTGELGTTATCTVTNANSVIVAGPVSCANIYTGQFASLPDGTYTLSVVLRDDAGNISKPATSVFILDRTAPVPPTVVPPASPSNSTAPRWQITTPPGATLTCTLTRGHTVIMGPGACPASGVISLAGMPDGTYVLRVTATDSAGNVSAASITTYVLDTVAPSAPSLAYGSPSAGTSRDPFWGFVLPAGSTGRCELMQGGTVIATRTNCRGAVSFTINGPDGFYVVRIVAVDAAGNVSNPLVVGYQLYGHGGGVAGGSGGSGSGVSGGGGRQPTQVPARVPTPAPSPGTVQSLIEHLGAVAGQAGKVARKAAGGAASLVPSLPVIHDPLTNNVSQAVQHVINAVSKAGGGTGFPLLLLIVVAVFLMAQSRIDRRDPKLALASVAADDHLQFGPPPSRGDA